MLEFILERYNYWIFIVLMMTGLYIVISRGNLVKKIIGLNVFQTSVFIFYISIGKIAGGTAPILIGKGGGDHGGGHGDDHGSGHGDGHSAAEASAGHASDHANATTSLHDGHDANAALTSAGAHGEEHVSATADKILNNGHHVEAAANDLFSAPAEQSGFQVADAASEKIEAPHGYEGAHDAASSALGDVIYTNPLPHVLILTAIVVGVATTAVGLALAVRIREAYGTIEEDELETDDRIAEFGAGSEAAS